MIKRSPSKAPVERPASARITRHAVPRVDIAGRLDRLARALGTRGRLLVFGGLLFAVGTGLGTGLGLFLAPSEPVGVSVDLPPTVLDAPLTESQAMRGPPLPVTTRSSESAVEAYLDSVPPPPEPAPQLTPSVPDATPPQPSLAEEVVAALAQPPVQTEPPATPEVLPDSLPRSSPAPAADPEAWRAYIAPTPPPSGKPRIAIVLDDLGIDQPRSWQAVELTAPMTLAILPYGYNLQALSDAARAKGHEVLVHVPMAPMDLGVDPGPNALQRELGPAEILRRLNWDLSQFTGYIGVNNHMGSRFSSDPESMTLVINDLRQRGLAFLDSVTTTETQGYALAEAAGIPFARRDVFLDNDTAPEAILTQLRRLETVAQTQGYAIGIGHPRDETLAVIRSWRPGAEARGIEFVPLSALLTVRAPS